MHLYLGLDIDYAVGVGKCPAGVAVYMGKCL